MFTIKQTPEFEQWISGLKDGMTRIRLAKRLDKAQRGNLGDVESVGEGVSEMREHFGPGWRMYYAQRGGVLIVMLGGGDKSTQRADIKQAIVLAKTLQE
ncbi:type II toxin-antitoxin system RelE/ParE family toxin [Pusillimonas noertemannii]|uniref:Putative addiction module killer protein n=1 Tax=Pusillimonas noertemannii TaxID=305977 RepID=A0A2U1CRM2_9BURK|nr:type II toxin-antitoxin system RelE/ParE family toxin [Pusillimonas noertemannii]NYT67880.1 type II toxin-antitoxin system RelE/ParE family toxin [Pusillimonas noertemannii]PVY68550.1 putative addiction module killer protein [Pusillimonas noertemannii]TFL11976.1 type II toxin-antitoxin system RelE/ParE family toxin [Pusillimonas noertemannii]